MHPGSPRANPSPRVAASLSRLAAPCSSQKSALLSVRLELSACGDRVGALPTGLPARAPPLAPRTADALPAGLRLHQALILALQASPTAELLGEGDPKHRENPGWVAAAPETVGSWWPRGQGPGRRPCLLLSISLALESHCRPFPGPPILPGVLRPLYTVPVSGVEVAERMSPLFPGNEQNSQQTGFYFSQPLMANK